MAFHWFGVPDVRRKARLAKSVRELQSDIEALEIALNHVGYSLKAGGYDDLLPSGVTIGPAPTGPAAISVYNGNLAAYEFVGASLVKSLILGFQTGHRGKEFTDLIPHIHLYIPNNTTGADKVVRFGFEYTSVSANGVEGATTTIYGTRTVPASAGNIGNAILSFPAITGVSLSTLISARLFRDPTHVDDTFASSVWLKSADIHFEVDAFGSRDWFSK